MTRMLHSALSQNRYIVEDMSMGSRVDCEGLWAVVEQALKRVTDVFWFVAQAPSLSSGARRIVGVIQGTTSLTVAKSGVNVSNLSKPCIHIVFPRWIPSGTALTGTYHGPCARFLKRPRGIGAIAPCEGVDSSAMS